VVKSVRECFKFNFRITYLLLVRFRNRRLFVVTKHSNMPTLITWSINIFRLENMYSPILWCTFKIKRKQGCLFPLNRPTLIFVPTLNFFFGVRRRFKSKKNFSRSNLLMVLLLRSTCICCHMPHEHALLVFIAFIYL